MGELTCERRLVVRSGAEAIQLRWIEPGGHSPRPMKLARATHPLLIAALLAMPAGVNGQVVSDFPVCTNYRERYQGGGFDSLLQRVCHRLEAQITLNRADKYGVANGQHAGFGGCGPS